MSDPDQKTAKKLNEEELAQATGGGGEVHRDDVESAREAAEADNSEPLPGHITRDDKMGAAENPTVGTGAGQSGKTHLI